MHLNVINWQHPPVHAYGRSTMRDIHPGAKRVTHAEEGRGSDAGTASSSRQYPAGGRVCKRGRQIAGALVTSKLRFPNQVALLNSNEQHGTFLTHYSYYTYYTRLLTEGWLSVFHPWCCSCSVGGAVGGWWRIPSLNVTGMICPCYSIGAMLENVFWQLGSDYREIYFWEQCNKLRRVLQTYDQQVKVWQYHSFALLNTTFSY